MRDKPFKIETRCAQSTFGATLPKISVEGPVGLMPDGLVDGFPFAETPK